MRKDNSFRALLAVGVCAAWMSSAVLAQATGEPAKPQQPPPATSTETKTTTVTTEAASDSGYLGVSDFFNIREANPNVHAGEWELELTSVWETGNTGGDDDVGAGTSIKYGITDTTWIGLELLPINFGDGGNDGAGDLGLTLFNRCWAETDMLPAFASWIEARFPSGDGSEGIDAEMHFNLTKTLTDGLRAHVEGFVKTANGSQGDDLEDWRHFQCGVGPGIDYQFTDSTVGVLNYLFQAGEEYGEGSSQVVEAGVVHKLSDSQSLKFAVDVDVDGASGDPNVGAKLQWVIDLN